MLLFFNWVPRRMDTLVMLLQRPKNLQNVFMLLQLIIKIALNFLLTFLVQKSSMFFTEND